MSKIILSFTQGKAQSEAAMSKLKDVKVKTWSTGGPLSFKFKEYHAKVTDKKSGKSAEATGGTKDEAIENAKTSLEKIL